MIEFAAASGPRLMLDEASVLDIGGCIVDGVDIAPKRAIPDDGDARIDHSLEGFLHMRAGSYPPPPANSRSG